MRRLCAALGLWLLCATAPLAQGTVTLSSEQLLAIGERALEAGDFATARRVAETFLAETPDSPRALLLGGYAALRAGDAETAIARGQAVWRGDGPRPAKRAAAELVAEAHLSREAFTPALTWLRRAARVAEPGPQRDRIRRAAARVEVLAPTRFTFGLTVAPSNNVNGGADSPFIVAEGVPLVGTLSESAQALSGTVADLSFSARHRLSQSRNHRLIIGAALFAREVWLSEDAREKAPDLSNSDLSYRRIDAFIQRETIIAEGVELTVSAGPGFVWQAEEARDALLSFDVQLATRLDALAGADAGRDAGAGILRFGFAVEQAYAQDDSSDQTRIDLSAAYRVPLAGGQLTTGLRLGETRSQSEFERSYRQTILAGWQRPLEGLPITLGLSAARSFTTYPDYTLLGIPVTGGRRDIRTVLRAQTAFRFENPWGLVPVLSFTVEETTSNVSRFETDELGLGLSIRRSF
ncbi:MAG: tetratricopeptide repeat protein [Pseudomonadota bacterium]